MRQSQPILQWGGGAVGIARHVRKYQLSIIHIIVLIPGFFTSSAYVYPQIMRSWGPRVYRWSGYEGASQHRSHPGRKQSLNFWVPDQNKSRSIML